MHIEEKYTAGYYYDCRKFRGAMKLPGVNCKMVK